MAEGEAFTCIQDAVRDGTAARCERCAIRWRFERVHVSAPPRIDLGGGWSRHAALLFRLGRHGAQLRPGD